MDLRDLLGKARWEFKHHRNVVFIGTGVSAFLLVGIAATLTMQASLKTAKSQLADLTREVEMSKTTGLAQLTPIELAKIEKRLNLFKDGFVSGAEISSVLNHISDQAEKSGIRVVSINSEDAVSMKTDTLPEQKFTRFPIHMLLEGRYQAMAEFLHSLGQSSRQVFVVESYKIVKTKEADALSCEMVLSFFWGS